MTGGLSLDKWRRRVRELKTELYALYLAYRDPRVPLHARIFAACVVAYAFSPIDLIPDFIPILGYLDDLLLVPLGIVLARRMIPADVLAECRARARAVMAQGKPVSRVGLAFVIVVWLILAALAAFWLLKIFNG